MLRQAADFVTLFVFSVFFNLSVTVLRQLRRA
jgi:hypothetical protein